MNYCVVSPAEIATVSFWERLCELDWVVCATETADLSAETTEAILQWLSAHLEHPVVGMTIGHFHLFVETFSRDLGHAVPVVGPKFLSGAAASNPAHIRVFVPAGESSVSEFVSLLAMTETEQKAMLFGETAQVTPQVAPEVTPQVEEKIEEPVHDSRVHYRTSGRRRHSKGAPAVDRQGQPLDPGQPADDAPGTGTGAGPGGSEI